MRFSPFGPILGKELRTTARRKRTYWLRFVYLAAMFLFLLLAYTSTAYRGYQYNSIAQRANAEAELGYAFFQTFAMFSIFAMPLIAPILTSSSISSERLGRTLNVLLMTPITSWQVVSGKLFSRLLIALMLLALSLPVLAVVRLLGGVDLDAMFVILGLCALTALTAAAVGLFLSTLIHRTYAVIILAYLVLGFLWGLLPLMLWLLVLNHGGRRAQATWFVDFMSVTNPFYHVVLNAMGVRRRMIQLSWGWCALFQLVLTGLLIWATSVLLRRRVRRDGEPAKGAIETPLAGPPPLLAEMGSIAVNVAAPAPLHRARATREVGENPVLWGEIRRPLFAKRWQALVGGFITIALLLFTYILLADQYTNELTQPDTHIGYAVIFCGVLTLLTCVVSATTISTEKESDTWTLLLATPLKARSIILGKVGGALRRLMWPTILVAAHFCVFAVAGVLTWTTVFLVIWVMLTFNSLWVATGLYYSLRLRNNTFAVVTNLLTPIAFMVVIPVIMLILGNLFESRHGHMLEWTAYYIPYPYLFSAIDGLSGKDGWSWDTRVPRIWLPYLENGVSPREFFNTAMTVGAIYLVLTWGMIELLAAQFNSLTGRAAQLTPLPPVLFEERRFSISR